ncbi:M1 family metallopeptidase [Bacteroidales bacterium]|nr:M1 family metallopeptidase [Bacteroidales bacterium]
MSFALKIIQLFILTISFHVSAQSLILPIEYRRSIEKSFRTYEGTPGDAYWVNGARYELNVRFSENIDSLYGQGTITYYNNSPNTIYKLYFNLYQNALKKGVARDWPVAVSDVHNGMEITSIYFNDDSSSNYASLLSYSGTLLPLTLAQKLSANDSVCIHITWNFRFPQFSNFRYGKYGSSYFVAYWYPEVCVFDDINQWDDMPFSIMQEYYHEFSDFSVSIETPSDYMLWATGDLQNPNDVYPKKVLNKLQLLENKGVKQTIFDKEDIKKMKPGKEPKRWLYTARNFPDFAFCMSTQYIWEATKVQDVTISSVYHPDNKTFSKTIDYSVATIEFFNQQFPQIAYPYKNLTVFEGNGGMEYPGLFNIGDYSTHDDQMLVTSHEIYHALFPFLMGINEKQHAYFDEGLTTYLPIPLQKKLATSFDPFYDIIRDYEAYAGSGYELPLISNTSAMSGKTYNFVYRHNAYNKAGLAFYYLSEILGEQLFFNTLHAFIDMWQYKHPTPYDFMLFCNSYNQIDLNWFWNNWFYGFGYTDLGIESIRKEKSITVISIINKGGLCLPINLKFYNDNKLVYTHNEDITIWKNNMQFTIITVDEKIKYDHVKLNQGKFPDADKNDNEWFEK